MPNYTTINKSTDHFNTKLYTGNGSTQSITGVGFQPDWTWIKNRTDGSTSHYLTDAVRGAGKSLRSNSTNAEATETNQLTAFDSDGFSIGNWGDGNGSGKNIVAWNWKGGGQGSSNTDGSINTTYTSANTTAGFSISTYTGTGSSATIGHGLGVAPEFIIIKRTSTAESWYVQATVLGYSKYLVLNSTAAQANTSGSLISSVSSSTVTVDGNGAVNGSGATYVMYAFASKIGYSKIGTYTGNGNADGPFIYLGFKPAFVVTKRTNSTSTWLIMDNKRDSFNVAKSRLFANESDAENTSANIMDLNSNGFKIRHNGTETNISGSTYIYMAFAEAPLVGSNNVPCTAR